MAIRETTQSFHQRLQNPSSRAQLVRTLARQEPDERTLIPARNLPWGRMNATEYLTGILDPQGFPERTRRAIKDNHLDPRDLLYSTTTASSVLIDDVDRLQYTTSFLDNIAKIPVNRPDIHARYLVGVQNRIRGEIADFLHLGDNGANRILLDHSGTHSALSLRMLFPDATVVMTTEVGRSLKTAYEGKHPFSYDVHGNTVYKNELVTGQGGRVFEIPIREGENGKPREEKDICDSFVKIIRDEFAHGRKTIILHVPLPPKTGVNPKERIQWMKDLKNPKTLRRELGIQDNAALPKLIILGDMAQTRYVYGTDWRGRLTDPTKDGAFCDIAMFASSKSIGGMPLSGILVMSPDIAAQAKRAVTHWQPRYIQHYINIGQLPDSWRQDVPMPFSLNTILDPRRAAKRDMHAADALTARLLSAGNMLANMGKMGVEHAQNNFRDIKSRWDSIISSKKGLARVYRDVSDKNTPSTISYQLENVNACVDAYQTAQTIRRMMLTPFSDAAIEATKGWKLTDKQKEAMSILFETGFPVSEEATGTNSKHKPILRIGLGWLQALDWEKTNYFHPARSRNGQITRALDMLATKLEVLATHVNDLQKLEPYAVRAA